ncbi:MAG: hypothetical protein ACRBBK_11225 [Paracoccaceae bacterium]
MSRPNPAIYAGFLIVLIIVLGAVAAVPGGLYVNRHEGDVLHLMEMLARMDLGQAPHLDFATPIGAFAFLPIVFLQKLGLGMGMAIVASQVLVALILAPFIWWAATSRLKGWVAYLFGASCIILVMALVHGLAKTGISVSMHYNRWAWGYAYVAILLALLPSLGARRPGVDGAIIGIMMAAMALTKMTYFVAFAPVVALVLILRKAWRSLGFGVFFGLLVAVIVTGFYGVDFWAAYANDLIYVATSDIRAAPGLPFLMILSSPQYLVGTVLVFASVILLRKGGHGVPGLALLLLAPSFFYVTYQNFGNDPQWLMLMAVLLLALPAKNEAPTGQIHMAQMVAIVAVFTLALPSMINLAASPFRHFANDRADFVPVVAAFEDVQVITDRMNRIDAKVALEESMPSLLPYVDKEARDEPTVFRGETLPWCQTMLGFGAMQEAVATELRDQAGLGPEDGLYVTDINGPTWLFGPFRPTLKAAPWNYGGAPGIRDADYVLIPLCPIAAELRGLSLAAMEERAVPMHEVYRSELLILMKVDGQGS